MRCTSSKYKAISVANALCYDVIIAGGGTVGSAIATSLSNKSEGKLKIGIVDARSPSNLETALKPDIPDSRVYAIAPTTLDFFQEADMRKYFGKRLKSYDNMQVWESKNKSLIRFSAEDLKIPELGCILEDYLIQEAAYKAIHEREFNVDILFGYSVKKILKETITSTSTEILIEDGNRDVKTLRTR